jgi:hypothetical protein
VKITLAPSLGWIHNFLVFCLSTTGLNAAFTISTNFESGSAKVIEIDPVTQTIRIMPGGDVDRGWPCWWYLRADGLDTNKPFTLQVTAQNVNRPGEDSKKGPRLAPDWSLPSRATFSTNGTDWVHTATGERRGDTAFYTVNTTSPTLWLAWGPPFTPRDSQIFVERMARTHSFAKAFSLARSREGRSVPTLRIAEGDKTDAERLGVWILARQHAWESGGTWVALGLAEWLVSDDERAQWLRANAEFFIVPIMDVDHTATGDGGKESLPQDPNCDWSDTPYWPEVAAVQKSILALTKESRMALLLDLHNPGASAKQVDLWITPTNFLSAPAARNQTSFFEAVRREAISPMTVKADPHWDGPRAGNDPYWLKRWNELSCPWVYKHAGPQTVAVTVETPWNIPASTTDGYRRVGQGLGFAIARYLRGQRPYQK